MYKSKLQELCQQRKWRLPEYNATKLGLDHNPRFSASVTINGVAFDTVQLFRSSKEAQNDAARLASLTSLIRNPDIPIAVPALHHSLNLLFPLP
ncbi:double-stranded-RNA-binding protein 4 [Prunus dulcis]|uniref:Double-stranded-RNA-binding protein 4 n=1 Tax=Prunus dulcis TaxID=3755 RepID=A0A4Y1R5U1_PRUDU|nr:double-stranded-RNA-binding protein 4 [Prunus dulcis]